MASTQFPTIQVQPREKLGSRSTARLRAQGGLPAVVYGHKQGPTHIWAHYNELVDLLRQQVHIIEVVCNGKSESCLIKDVQWDHLGSHIIHVDLARVDLNERVTVSVEVELVGEAIGLKEAHTYLDQITTNMEIECLASAIPANIKIDVSDLKENESLILSSVELPEGVTASIEPDAVIASVHIAAAAADDDDEEEAPEGAEASGEPDVISKKIEEEEPEK